MAPLSRSILGRLADPVREDFESVLFHLVTDVEAALGGNLLGAYLVGSFALGAGDEHSDVDFLIVTHHCLDRDQLSALRGLHARLPDSPSHWARHLEGTYVTAAALKNPTVADPWWWVDNGSRDLIEDQHDNTAVSRWVLRRFGIALVGPDPRTLSGVIGAEQLRAEAAAHLAKWQSVCNDEPAALNNAWLQQHAVLACCRDRFTIATGVVTSKVAAGRWAIEHLDQAWVPLIRRAIHDRPDPWGRVHLTADTGLAAETLSFIGSVE